MYSILLVDDERWVRSALCWTIGKTELPFTIRHECVNGLEALEWLKSNRVDLVLCDIQMPVMDGLTFIQELQRQEHNQDVILITVHDDFYFAQRALRLGASDYLLKPIDIDDLKRCLTKWIERQRQRQSGEELTHVHECGTASIDLVLQYIQKNPLAHITLADTASAIHMNPSYLSQLFKLVMHVNFVDYITNLKVKEANKLLSSTSLQISEIAYRLGYSDLAYFSSVFKKHTGMKPSEYRRQQQHQQ